MIQITCLISFSVFAFEKEQYLVFGGEEEPKRKMSKYLEKETIWYVGMRRRRRKKKKEKKDYVRRGKVKQRRKERKIFWRSKMSRWTDRQTDI